MQPNNPQSNILAQALQNKINPGVNSVLPKNKALKNQMASVSPPPRLPTPQEIAGLQSGYNIGSNLTPLGQAMFNSQQNKNNWLNNTFDIFHKFNPNGSGQKYPMTPARQAGLYLQTIWQNAFGPHIGDSKKTK